MSKDLKHRVPAFRHKKPWRVTPQAGLALVGGFLFVAILAAGYLHRGKPGPAAPPPSPPVSTPEPPPAPEFNFFKILPDNEREIPESVINAEKREVRLGNAPKAGHFYLQIGSFTRLEQAESVKARLARFKPKLEQINLEYASWYRVKLGPYRTLTDADQIRQALRQQHIDSIVQAPVE